jgi:hypothetical protein
MDTGYDDRNGMTRRDDSYARPSMAAPWVLIGSIVLIVGAFLDWASGTGATNELGATTGTNDLSGYNLIDGRIAGALGVTLLIAAVLMWANKRVGSWFDSDLLAVALSGFAGVLIVMWLMDVGNEALSADYGAYVSLAGAAIAFIGALAALLRSGSDRATQDEEGRGSVGQRRAAISN